MRLSADKNDFGYHPDGKNWDVVFNGRQLVGVVTADEELGLIVEWERDADGRFVIDRIAGEVKTVRRYGKVELRRRLDVPAVSISLDRVRSVGGFGV